MATSDNEGKFKGGIGNLTYRIIGSKVIVQSKPGPGKVKQTVATRASNIDFCLGSNRAKILRVILFPMIKGNYDAKMVGRFTSAVAAVIRSNTSLAPGYRDLEDGQLDLLCGFEFNIHAPFSKLLKAKLSMEQSYFEGIRISLGSFKVKEALTFPEMASGCVLRVLITAISLKDNQYQYCGSAEMKIPVERELVPDTEWTFMENLPKDCLFMATCSLEFYADGLSEPIYLNHKGLHPVSIIGMAQSQDFETQNPVPEAGSAIWNRWLPIAGIDGNKLRKG